MEIFLPLHQALHDLLGQKLCGWPGIFGLCLEFWIGFAIAWIIIKNKPQAKFFEVIKDVAKKSKKKKEDKDKE